MFKMLIQIFRNGHILRFLVMLAARHATVLIAQLLRSQQDQTPLQNGEIDPCLTADAT